MKSPVTRDRSPTAQPVPYLEALPTRARRIAAALRRVILQQAPGVDEAIKFGTLCYFGAGVRFGAIGGNVCMIEARDGGIRLSFIHGASLPDPAGLLRGTAVAKRFVPISSVADARRPELAALIRASAALVRTIATGA